MRARNRNFDNDFQEGCALTLAWIAVIFIILFIVVPAASYEPDPPDTTCRDAESLRMRDDCNFGRGDSHAR